MKMFWAERRVNVLLGAAIAAVASAGTCVVSQASIVTLIPTDIVHSSGSPGAVGTLSLTITTDVAGGVDADFALGTLGQPFDALNTWWFMVDSVNANHLTFTELSRVGTFSGPAAPNQRATPASQIDGVADYYNTWLNGFGGFESGDSITYHITSSAGTLTPEDFLTLDGSTSGAYSPKGIYSTAVLIDAGASSETQTGELYVEGGGSTGATPEPASLGLLGLGTAAMLVRKRRK